MLPRFSSQRNLGYYEQDQIDANAIPPKNDENEVVQRQTQSLEMGSQLKCVPRPPKKKLPPKEDISFETRFLHEHTTSFQRKFQNFLEFALNTCRTQITEPPIEPQTLYFHQDPRTSISNVLNSPKLKLCQHDILDLTHNLKEQEDLQDFLDYISRQCTQQFTCELVVVARDAWQAFTPIQYESSDKKYLIKEAQALVTSKRDHYFKYSDFNYLNARILGPKIVERQQFLFESFTNLLNYFCTTIFLIIAGYFQNPYAQIQTPSQSVLASSFQHSNLFGFNQDSDGEFEEDSFQLEGFQTNKRIKLS